LIIHWPQNGNPRCPHEIKVMLKTRANFISIECGMGCHISKTTIPYRTPSPLHFITSFQYENTAHLFVAILPRIVYTSTNYPNITWNPDLHRMQNHNRVLPQWSPQTTLFKPQASWTNINLSKTSRTWALCYLPTIAHVVLISPSDETQIISLSYN